MEGIYKRVNNFYKCVPRCLYQALRIFRVKSVPCRLLLGDGRTDAQTDGQTDGRRFWMKVGVELLLLEELGFLLLPTAAKFSGFASVDLLSLACHPSTASPVLLPPQFCRPLPKWFSHGSVVIKEGLIFISFSMHQYWIITTWDKIIICIQSQVCSAKKIHSEHLISSFPLQ